MQVRKAPKAPIPVYVFLATRCVVHRREHKHRIGVLADQAREWQTEKKPQAVGRVTLNALQALADQLNVLWLQRDRTRAVTGLTLRSEFGGPPGEPNVRLLRQW